MNQLDFTGRVVIVTGANGGLGRAYTRLLASRGAALAVNDVKGAEIVAQELSAGGAKVIASSHDISTPEGAAELIKATTRAYGRVDALINNAGVGGIKHQRPFAKDDLVDFEFVLRVNCMSVRHLAHAVWPIMAAQKYGRIVNTTSSAGLFGHPTQTGYNVSKAGVHAITRTLALEGAPLGIKVNSISPAAYTPMSAAAVPAAFLEEFKATYRPEQVAPAVAVLAHESCPSTGETIEAFAGRIGRMFVAANAGTWDAAWTPESVLNAWSDIMDLGEYRMFDDAYKNPELLPLAVKRARKQ